MRTGSWPTMIRRPQKKRRRDNVPARRLAFGVPGAAQGSAAAHRHRSHRAQSHLPVRAASGLVGQQQSPAPSWAGRRHPGADDCMGVVEESPREKRRWLLLFGILVLIGLALRFWLATFARMPGHGDSAFYYTVARNIADGRGPVVDYIVYFFSGLLPLPHYAGDFWNPTASYLIAIPMLLFGRSITAALVAPILASLVPAAAGFLAARRYSGSTAIGALAGILTFFSAFEVWFSVTTEAIIFAGAFGALALYFMMKREPSGHSFLLAAVFTGLANLIRQDNILLLVTLVICILLA